MKRWSTAATVAAMMMMPVAARAGTVACSPGVNPFAATVTPVIYMCINNQPFLFSGFGGTGKPFTLATQTGNFGNGSFTVSATYNNDPFVSFMLTTTVSSGQVNVDAYFSTPVVGGGYNSASSAGTLSVTANGSNANVSVINGFYPNYISGYANVSSLNVDTGLGSCAATTAGQTITSTTVCNPPGANATFAPISPNVLAGRLSYKQTTVTGSSTAAFTGIVSLTAATTVPEPATVTLMFVGMLALGAFRLRRTGN